MSKFGVNRSDPLQQVVRGIRGYLTTLLGVSGMINLLGLALSLYIMQVYDRVLSSRSYDTLLFLSIAALLALTSASALDGLRSYILARMADWGARRLAPEILMRSIERRLIEGNLRSELLRELTQLRNFLAGPGVSSLLDLPWAPIYLIIAFLIHPLLGVIALVGTSLLFGLAVLNERLTHADIRHAARISSEALRESDAIIRNAEVIDSLGMAPQLTKRWLSSLLAELALQERVQRRSTLLVSSTRFARAAIQVVLYAFAAALVLNQEMSGGAMFAGSIIISRLLSPVESVVVHWRSMLLAREGFSRLSSFFALEPLRSTHTKLPVPKGALSVERVTLAVPGQTTPILRGIDFQLAAGEHLAIVGPAASGKTTLSRVMLGILRPQSGVVRLDGVDVSQWQREEFGRHIGYLPQDVELFAGTVAHNIARFQNVSDQQIIRAAQLAGCHELILSLPNAYDTEIGEGGMLLSGGQRQQVALARALFGKPRFVVLDEPNSNLDNRGDQALRTALDRLRRAGVTAVIVTHRQSVIAQVDRLLILHQGMVRAFGPTAEALAMIRGDMLAKRVTGDVMRPESVEDDQSSAEAGQAAA